MNWTIQGETVPRGYAFAYDNLSRLTGANYLLNGSASATNDYKVENIIYDKHGNIKNLRRYGKTSSGATYALVDNLTMTYSGNQLVHAADAITNPAYSESADFKDKVSTTGTIEYTYTANGAMNKDLNKGISEIQYNSLNLPQVMIINSPTAKAKNYYTYSASGVKLRTEQRYDPNYTVTPSNATNPANDGLADYMNRDYAGNIIYETAKNGSAITNRTRILVDGGYWENNVYYFYVTDHLGNNRVVVNQSGTVTQKSHYYPFGTAFADKYDNGTSQPYKYNGKELDGMHQLNLYDYSARYYESALGRFTSVDPHAEKYYSISPYVYCYNNPLKYIDPDGKDGIFIAFPDYRISAFGKKWENLGHAGILLIDNESGLTKYYEYGRYDKAEKGEVRQRTVSNVIIGKDGKPTIESLNKVMKEISDVAGDKGRIEGAYVKSDKFREMDNYAQTKKAENNDPKRKEYSIWTNNCGTFAADVLKQDTDAKKKAPAIVDPRPNSMVKEYQNEFNKVTYDPKTKKTKLEE